MWYECQPCYILFILQVHWQQLCYVQTVWHYPHIKPASADTPSLNWSQHSSFLCFNLPCPWSDLMASSHTGFRVMCYIMMIMKILHVSICATFLLSSNANTYSLECYLLSQIQFYASSLVSTHKKKYDKELINYWLQQQMLLLKHFYLCAVENHQKLFRIKKLKVKNMVLLF